MMDTQSSGYPTTPERIAAMRSVRDRYVGTTFTLEPPLGRIPVSPFDDPDVRPLSSWSLADRTLIVGWRGKIHYYVITEIEADGCWIKEASWYADVRAAIASSIMDSGAGRLLVLGTSEVLIAAWGDQPLSRYYLAPLGEEPQMKLTEDDPVFVRRRSDGSLNLGWLPPGGADGLMDDESARSRRRHHCR